MECQFIEYTKITILPRKKSIYLDLEENNQRLYRYENAYFPLIFKENKKQNLFENFFEPSQNNFSKWNYQIDSNDKTSIRPKRALMRLGKRALMRLG